MTATPGRLLLVPNTLDLGTDCEVPLDTVLPQAVIAQAAGLGHWVCENAKTTRALLKRVHALVPLAQPLQQIQIRELPRPPKGRADPKAPAPDWAGLLAPALAGHDVGLVSEAGLPAVADPGAELVRVAHAQGITVMPLSGPSSLILAVAASGLNGQSFAFVGYLPTDAAERTRRLRDLEAHSKRWQQTQLLIETPYRNAAMAQALLAALSPQTWLSISCGLTLEGGSTRTLRVAQWRASPPELPGDVPAVFAFLA